MAVQRMSNHISVLDNPVHVFTRLAIDRDLTRLNGMLVVFSCTVSKFRCENIENFSTTPSLFAEGVVREVVWGNSAQAFR
jgi:hypothetical protein